MAASVGAAASQAAQAMDSYGASTPSEQLTLNGQQKLAAFTKVLALLASGATSGVEPSVAAELGVGPAMTVSPHACALPTPFMLGGGANWHVVSEEAVKNGTPGLFRGYKTLGPAPTTVELAEGNQRRVTGIKQYQEWLLTKRGRPKLLRVQPILAFEGRGRSLAPQRELIQSEGMADYPRQERGWATPKGGRAILNRLGLCGGARAAELAQKIAPKLCKSTPCQNV
jgi:hypothetical protein